MVLQQKPYLPGYVDNTNCTGTLDKGQKFRRVGKGKGDWEVTVVKICYMKFATNQ